MNDKSSPEELIKYRRYTLKMLWGGTMYWFATSRGKGKPHNRDARHMAEVYFDRFEREAERLLADLQSNGDIQITGPEESVLKRRRTDHDHRCIPALCRRKGRKTMFTSIVRRYQAWRRCETVRRELSHLTDRELADIGITRSDIERIASGEAHTFAECGRLMGIGKPAKILNEHQLQALLLWLETRKHALLSFKAGLRTKVIACLK